MAQAPRIDVWRENLLEERDGAALYEGLAAAEKDSSRAEVFRRLAEGERRHGAVWEKKLREAGAEVPAESVSPRVRTLLWLARRFGTKSVLPLVMRTEANDAARYKLTRSRETDRMAKEEEEHRQELQKLNGGGPSGVSEQIASRERWHKGGKAGSVRAAVFGVNDGLVSNVALVLGVAAAGAEGKTLLVTGLAGLFAGAFSMAVGEYVSVASQRDLLRAQVRQEQRELEEAPEEEQAELVDLLRQKGLTDEQAERTARDIMQSPEAALDTLVREELGLDPSDLGSPVAAAFSSFFAFAVGAIIPVLPFVWLAERAGIIVSAAASAVVLASVGGVLGFLSGSGAVKSAARMVLLASIATAVTVLVGRLVGANIG